jgi:3-methyladenine DNA glycosylase AlkD
LSGGEALWQNEKYKNGDSMQAGQVVAILKGMRNPVNIAGMAKFGIRPAKPFGIPIPFLRAQAKQIGIDHELALALWESGIHEARILASMIDDPASVTSAQAERWVKGFDSWDVCDQVCGNLFWKTAFARQKAELWIGRKPEFVRRAGFTMMAEFAWHDPEAPNDLFMRYLDKIEAAAVDERQFVKKAVNWALRNIGKRNPTLNRAAIAAARRIAKRDSKSARWIAADALRELQNPKTLARLKQKVAG